MLTALDAVGVRNGYHGFERLVAAAEAELLGRTVGWMRARKGVGGAAEPRK